MSEGGADRGGGARLGAGEFTSTKELSGRFFIRRPSAELAISAGSCCPFRREDFRTRPATLSTQQRRRRAESLPRCFLPSDYTSKVDKLHRWGLRFQSVSGHFPSLLVLTEWNIPYTTHSERER